MHEFDPYFLHFEARRRAKAEEEVSRRLAAAKMGGARGFPALPPWTAAFSRMPQLYASAAVQSVLAFVVAGAVERPDGGAQDLAPSITEDMIRATLFLLRAAMSEPAAVQQELVLPALLATRTKDKSLLQWLTALMDSEQWRDSTSSEPLFRAEIQALLRAVASMASAEQRSTLRAARVWLPPDRSDDGTADGGAAAEDDAAAKRRAARKAKARARQAQIMQRFKAMQTSFLASSEDAASEGASAAGDEPGTAEGVATDSAAAAADAVTGADLHGSSVSSKPAGQSAGGRTISPDKSAATEPASSGEDKPSLTCINCQEAEDAKGNLERPLVLLAYAQHSRMLALAHRRAVAEHQQTAAEAVAPRVLAAAEPSASAAETDASPYDGSKRARLDQSAVSPSRAAPATIARSLVGSDVLAQMASPSASGVHVRTCGHAMHADCLASYCRARLEMVRRNPFIRATERFHLGEYHCPLCHALSNTALPILPESAVLHLHTSSPHFTGDAAPASGDGGDKPVAEGKTETPCAVDLVPSSAAPIPRLCRAADQLGTIIRAVEADAAGATTGAVPAADIQRLKDLGFSEGKAILFQIGLAKEDATGELAKVIQCVDKASRRIRALALDRDVVSMLPREQVFWAHVAYCFKIAAAVEETHPHAAAAGSGACSAPSRATLTSLAAMCDLALASTLGSPATPRSARLLFNGLIFFSSI